MLSTSATSPVSLALLDYNNVLNTVGFNGLYLKIGTSLFF